MNSIHLKGTKRKTALQKPVDLIAKGSIEIKYNLKMRSFGITQDFPVVCFE